MSILLSTTKYISRINTLPITRAFTTTPALQRIGGARDRDPKIKITLEQLRMAARGRGRGVPICHDQQEKIMNALEAAKFENGPIYKYVMEFDKCYEEHERTKKQGKDRSLMKELNKYLVRPRKKQK